MTDMNEYFKRDIHNYLVFNLLKKVRYRCLEATQINRPEMEKKGIRYHLL